jgi:CRISPR type III-B/RAMP module RAMP protein Cmr1
MEKATIEFKAVTPAFIHRESSGEAEFRIPSLRGVLRFWTRAVYGPFRDLQRLFEEEAELWGKTDRASPVRLWIEGETLKNNDNDKFPLLPHYTRKQDSSPSKALSPTSTMRGGDRRAGQAPDRPSKALSPSSTVRVHMEGPADVVRQAIRILRLALALGGLGQRSRRGAGSFDVQVVKPPGDLEEQYRNPLPRDPQRLAQWIKTTLEQLQRDLGNPGHSNGKAPFPMLCPRPHECAMIRVRQSPSSDSESARKDIMIALKNYKSPSWGLPYLKPAPGHSPIERVRWASPAHFRILPADKGFLEVLTILKSPFPVAIQAHLQKWDEVDRFAKNFGGVLAWP